MLERNSLTRRYYDAHHERIVCIQEGSGAAFWSMHWRESLRNAEYVFRHPPAYHTFLYVTRRHLPAGSRVIDGGCGLALTVHALDRSGYEAYGVDFSSETVTTIHGHWPHLRLSCQDIRRLAFADHFFDGYWSIGVIEHFYHGYEEVLREMSRTIRPGGYLFLTFPVMNILRRFKARRGDYPPYREDDNNRENFYQFLLPAQWVQRQVESAGFRLVRRGGQSVVRTFKEEWPWCERGLDRLFSIPWGVGRLLSLLLDIVLGRWLGHMSLMIFVRQGEGE
ncbi:class I SAM-dependent methyltransferase [Candidatus Magnetaquicoccus inordinatus]|uniref:class I SAM-dependent methyltransferase n=1 Tax=Candidatus Magnetaquicoccus inordinatus TaxID=2496818 RepID=UPI00102B98C6|nr:class I SAM-dependent methyltransferase [Candidatus Magnetaquicoccus inordinatus]